MSFPVIPNEAMLVAVYMMLFNNVRFLNVIPNGAKRSEGSFYNR